jgi:hypothetical protein
VAVLMARDGKSAADDLAAGGVAATLQNSIRLGIAKLQ